MEYSNRLWLYRRLFLPVYDRFGVSNTARSLFSCCFFFVLSKIALIFTTMVGWQSIPCAPFYDEQDFGAFLSICVLAAWNARRHLHQICLSAFGRSAEFHLPHRLVGIDWRIYFSDAILHPGRDGLVVGWPAIYRLLCPVGVGHPIAGRVWIPGPQSVARNPLFYPVTDNGLWQN